MSEDINKDAIVKGHLLTSRDTFLRGLLMNTGLILVLLEEALLRHLKPGENKFNKTFLAAINLQTK